MDEDADAGPQVGGFEIEEVDEPHGAAVERLDDQPQLPRGVEVEALLVEKTPERVAREGAPSVPLTPHTAGSFSHA